MYDWYLATMVALLLWMAHYWSEQRAMDAFRAWIARHDYAIIQLEPRWMGRVPIFCARVGLFYRIVVETRQGERRAGFVFVEGGWSPRVRDVWES